MNIVIKGRHLEVTQALKQRAEEKLKKITKHFNHILKADVEMIYEQGKPKRNQICEITLFAERAIFRAHAEGDDMYSAIDRVVQKLERQIQKYKGKSYISENKRTEKLTMVNQRTGIEKPKILKKKSFEIWRMGTGEAVMQMEFLNHDFFVYINDDTERINILYKRKDGGLGLIETIQSER